MDEHPLAGFMLKYRRAEEHFQALHESVDAYMNSDFYGVGLELDRERRPVVKVQRFRPPPDEWSILIGEFAYNLRSALDHLAYQLAVANLGDPLPPHIEKASAFPIFNNGPLFRRRDRKGKPTRGSGLHKIQGIARPAQTAIERLQPYHRRKNPAAAMLWMLEELANVDKHRLIHVVATVLEESSYRLESADIIGLAGVKAYSRPFKENAVIARFDVAWIPGIPEPDMKVNLTLSTEVRFDRRSPANSVRLFRPLFVLPLMLQFVWGAALPSLAPLLSGPRGVYEFVPASEAPPET